MALKKRKFDFKMTEEASREEVKSGVLKFHNVQNESDPSDEPTSKKFISLKKEEQAHELKKKRFKNNNYFNVKNHIDLFEIGKYYSDLLETGLNSFAFFGGENSSSVYHSILGIASYFNFHRNMKAVIFVEKFEGSELAKFLKPTHVEMELVDPATEDAIEYYSCDGIDIMEYSKLRHLAYKVGIENFSEYLNSLIQREKIVLWNLPSSVQLDKEREFFLPIIHALDSVSFVVDQGKTKRCEMQSMYEVMTKYTVQVEGSIFYKR